MGNAGAALGIIGIIIGAGAIGFAFFVWNGTNSDLDDLTDQVNSMTGPSNTTAPTDLTDELNNLTDAFNNLTYEFNNLTDEFNDLESEFSNLTKTIVVGIWTGLDENIDNAPHISLQDWLLELEDNVLINTDYISVSNMNTRIALLKSGWYRIHLNTLLGSSNPVIRGKTCYVLILKDGTNIFTNWHTFPDTQTWYRVDLSVFVYSDGTNYLEINGYSSYDFSPSHVNLNNQFTIEYVVV